MRYQFSDQKSGCLDFSKESHLKFREAKILKDLLETVNLRYLYYYMKNYCNLIGLGQWYFSLI